jgi:outer membrane usher protein
MSLPLIRGESALGDVQVQVDSSGAIALESRSAELELGRLLNEAGKQRLSAAIGGDPFVSLPELEAQGFLLRYNSSGLELVIERIDTSLLAVENLGENSQRSATPAFPMSDISAYLNINLNLEHARSAGGFRNPDLFLFGAARAGNVVVEIDGGFTSSFDDGYRFYRRSARAVYDDRESFRRYSAGDLRLTSIPLLGTQFLAGAAVEKSRRIFDPSQPFARLGGQQILLDTASTVEVFVNGSKHRTLRLQPGAYDLAELPLQYGSNDVQILIRDAAGRQQVTRFDYFFDPIDLPAGEEEYAAAIGVAARQLGFEANYSDDPVIVGHYRKALNNEVALGAGVQISADRQVVGVEARLVPQVIPGAFDLQAAVSRGGETGVAIRAGYRWTDGNPLRGRRLSLSLNYESRNFRLIGEPQFAGIEQLTVNATYSQNLSVRTAFTTGLSYAERSGGLGGEKSAFAELNHQLNQRLRGTFGAEVGKGDLYPRNFGVRAGIAVLLGNRGRADATYESRRETARASFSRGAENYAGSVGYDFAVQDTPGSTSADASATYIGNRFEANLSFIGAGRDLGNFGSDRSARLQIGTSIAFAGGHFGVGRPISDSFMLVRPHRTLGDAHVITGRELNRGRYESRSGFLGAAVVPELSSYNPRNILYDVDTDTPGYDIGSGLVHVDPPFRSGGVVTVGTDRFVSVLGNVDMGGKPASLVSGSVSSVDDKGFEPQPFFTNSAGRFSILGLAPGKSYNVRLADGQTFTITVPAENTGLYRMGIVRLPGKGE